MENNLSVYVTLYKDPNDIVEKASHYLNITDYFPLTVSYNISAHENTLDLATDLLRLWDVFVGANQLLKKTIPNELFLTYLRSNANSELPPKLSLRIVGLAAYPNQTIAKWIELETVISHLLTLQKSDRKHLTSPISAAEHFANIIRDSHTTHLWILGQGDYPQSHTLMSLSDIFRQEEVPDILTIAVGHSIAYYPRTNQIFDRIQMRYLEPISGSIYRTTYLRHMPLQSKRWWPHMESVLHEAQISMHRQSHLLIGWQGDSNHLIYVSVEPSNEWSKSQNIFDDVLTERLQICLKSLPKSKNRYEWFFSLETLGYAEVLHTRGRMSERELAELWAATAQNGSGDSGITLRPKVPVVIEMKGNLGQQIQAAATYLKLKFEGHIVYADFAPTGNSDANSSKGVIDWHLDPLGISIADFDPLLGAIHAPSFTFKSGGEAMLQFSIAALAQDEILNLLNIRQFLKS